MLSHRGDCCGWTGEVSTNQVTWLSAFCMANHSACVTWQSTVLTGQSAGSGHTTASCLVWPTMLLESHESGVQRSHSCCLGHMTVRCSVWPIILLWSHDIWPSWPITLLMSHDSQLFRLTYHVACSVVHQVGAACVHLLCLDLRQ